MKIDIRDYKLFSRKAFSFIEISIVLLVIGILLSGIAATKSFIEKSKIANAQLLTNQSPVNDIQGLTIWLETTMNKSFASDSINDGDKIATWYDINANALFQRNATQGNSSFQPIYRKKIVNSLPMIEFSSSAYFNLVDQSIADQNKNYSFFIVAKLGNCSSTCDIISSGVNVSNNLNAVKYTNSSIANSWGASQISASSTQIKNPHIYSFEYNNAVGRKIFIDSAQAESDSQTSRYSGSNNNLIGNSSNSINGYIGEIIIFERSLKSEERKEVEKYLSNKWQIELSE
jgi:prepilin-type N-terminal cleavage/methylation domain-containing protein